MKSILKHLVKITISVHNQLLRVQGVLWLLDLMTHSQRPLISLLLSGYSSLFMLMVTSCYLDTNCLWQKHVAQENSKLIKVKIN
jgi:hypothetical protein